MLLLVLGITGAGILVGIADWVLRDAAMSAGQRTLQTTALRVVDYADNALDEALTTLTELALSGISSCDKESVSKMLRSAYRTNSVKYIDLVDDSGSFACNIMGIEDEIVAISEVFAGRNSAISLQAVRIGTGDNRGIRLVWDFGSGEGLVAIVSGRTLAFDMMPDHWRKIGLQELRLTDGTLIGGINEMQPRTDPNHDDPIIALEVASDRYPLVVSLAVPFSAVWKDYKDLVFYARLGGTLVAVFATLLAVVAAFRGPGRANELERGLRRREFHAYYQPIIDIKTGRLKGCEALIRRITRDGTVISPGAFIAVAEATGLAVPMTRQLMERIREDLSDAYFERPNLTVSINLFRNHLESLAIVDDIRDIFNASKIRYQQLVFELTERQPISNVTRAKAVIRSIHSLGAAVALDDAGTGHSGLASIQELGIDILKIDKLFVDGLDTNRFASPIIESLVRLAHHLQMTVVAEGVERSEQLDKLKELGIDYAQGYLFAPPLPAPLYVELVNSLEPLRHGPLVEPMEIDFAEDGGSGRKQAA
ncbi:MAG: EAL domain-containing protein [Hyphomicrobiales bacterium]|nr:EAL domain-containing protein [Hyphomicrobiales bacterium]